MPQVRVVYNGIPFRIEANGTPQQIEAAFKQRVQEDTSIVDKRIKQLGLTEDDVNQLLFNATNGEQGQTFQQAEAGRMSGGDKFLVGAGRTFKSLYHGVRQVFGDEDTDAAMEAREAEERELFNALDNQGIGMEDLGQLAPEVIAFWGSGGSSVLGSAASIGARGALLSGSHATVGDESRAVNTILGGLVSAGGGAAGKAIANSIGFLGKGAKLGAGGIRAVKELASKGPLDRQLGKVIGETSSMLQNKNPAVQKLGQMSLERASTLVQKLNSRGKEGVVAEAANTALQRSMKVTEQGLEFSTDKFVKHLANFGRPQMRKELGKALGTQLDLLRNTFTDLSKITKLNTQQAQTLLQGITTDANAQALARALTNAKTPAAKQAVGNQILRIVAEVSKQSATGLERSARNNLVSPTDGVIPAAAEYMQ